MALKTIVAAFLAPALVVYGAYTLWPTSSCQRVTNAAVPLYILGHGLRIGAEPFVSSDEHVAFVRSWPASFRSVGEGLVARFAYGSPTHEDMCERDPVRLLELVGRIDERGLLRAQAPPDFVPQQQVRSALQQPMTAHVAGAHSPQPALEQARSAWSVFWNVGWILLLAATVATVAFVAPVRAYVWQMFTTGAVIGWLLVPLRRVWAFHKDFFQHIWTREAVKPSAGKKKTDLS